VRHGILIVLVALLAVPALAELSAGPGGHAIHYLTPDGKLWAPVRRGVDRGFLLNPDGDLRGDGAPSFGVNPATGLPEAVWARQAGDYEIAFSRFDGERWTAPLLLTADGRDDVLPRLRFDPWGNRFVVWTALGEGSGVFLAAAPPGADRFWTPVRVSGEDAPARYPSLWVAEGGELWLSFQEDRGDGTFIIVVEIRPAREATGFVVMGGEDLGEPYKLLERRVSGLVGLGGGSEVLPLLPLGGHGTGLPFQPVRTSAALAAPARALPAPRPVPQRTAPETWPEIRQEGSLVWVEWLERPDLLGFSAWEGGNFSAPRYVPIQGGREEARDEVRRLIGDP